MKRTPRLHWSEKPDIDKPADRIREKKYGERVRKIALAYLEQLKTPDIKTTN